MRVRKGVGRVTSILGALGITLAALLSATPTASRAATAAAHRASASTSPLGKIKHVVVLFQENRSFDEVLGYWCTHPTHRCNGHVGPVKLAGGITAPMTQSPDVINPDVPHTVDAQTLAIDGGKMDGWGQLGAGCTSPGPNKCLTYYTPSQVPALTALAGAYAVSDHTFTGQNAPSWGGHMWVATSTQDGFTGDIPYFAYSKGWGCDADANTDWISPSGVRSQQPSCIPAPAGALNATQYPYRGAYKPTQVPNVPTIFDRLDAAHLPWHLYSTVYAWSVCPTFAKCLYGQQHHDVVPTRQFLTDAKNGTLPAYSVVLPDGGGGTGQHPPSSMLFGDNWIGKVVNALQASPDWSSTAMFVTYDDCGCFYDHVPPGVNPDGSAQGPRVPMVIVSPYAKRGGIDSEPATFASFMRFIEEAFGIAPLGVNDAKAYDYRNAFDFTTPPTAPRVWPRQQPIPAATRRLLASLPPNDDEAS